MKTGALQCLPAGLDLALACDNLLGAAVDPCRVFLYTVLACRQLPLPCLELARPGFDGREQRIEGPLAVGHGALGDVQDLARDAQTPGNGEPVGASRDAFE